MFTGIVEECGEVLDLQVDPDGSSARLTVRARTVTADAGHGDSIAVSGVCLTVVDRGSETFTVDVMAETLRRTTIGSLTAGAAVNLERSVLPTTRMGGHLVQGHVDGVGTLISRREHPGYDEIRIRVPAELARYLAPQGAVAVDGTSLTITDVVDDPEPDRASLSALLDAPVVHDGSAHEVSAHAPGAVFGIGVIPETRTATTLGRATVGSRVNIEVDVMAKYVERLLTVGRPVAEASEAHR